MVKKWKILKEVDLIQFGLEMFRLIFNKFSIEWKKMFLDVMLKSL